jgi:glycosyltransferase involved in cell wall biosynthesis
VVVNRRDEFIELARAAGISASVVETRDPFTGFRRVGWAARLTRVASWARHQLALWRELRRHQPNVVHANDLRDFVMIAPAAFALRRPVVVHVRGEMRMRHWHQLVLALARANVHVSHSLAARHLARCHPKVARRIARRGHVVNNGIDLGAVRAHAAAADRTELRAKLGLRPEEVAILSVGAFHPGKGQLELVRDVLPQVAASAPAARLLLAGGLARETLDETHEYSRAVGEAAARAGGRVALLGYRLDVYDLLVASDIAALASSSEGLARFLIESAAFGRPAVAFDSVGGDVVDHRASGVLVPFGDYLAFADALVELALDRRLRTTLGEGARQRAVDRFDTRVVVPQMEVVFDTACSS